MLLSVLIYLIRFAISKHNETFLEFLSFEESFPFINGAGIVFAAVIVVLGAIFYIDERKK